MLAKKNSKKSISGAVLVFALTLALAGCTPAGPHALLKGKKYIDRGDFADAVAELKTATTLLVTNAQAWNYYGVALQCSGQPDDAATAYQNALKYDRDLIEAHFNLGNLWLEQNKPDAAKTEFTAYTMRRNNDAAGWLKLGSAQLRLGETSAAEKSFSSVLALKPADAEAYNGLGLARVQRGMPHDAVKFFAAAVQSKSDFGGAILNLATVSQQYLHDNKTALENYHAYLALTPRPANWDDVNALANQLEQSQTTIADATPPIETQRPSPPVTDARTEVKSNYVGNYRPTASTKPQPRYVDSLPPIQTAPMQVEQVQPAPPIVTSPRASAAKPIVTYAPQAQTPAETPRRNGAAGGTQNRFLAQAVWFKKFKSARFKIS